jgi:hypothetical protein
MKLKDLNEVVDLFNELNQNRKALESLHENIKEVINNSSIPYIFPKNYKTEVITKKLEYIINSLEVDIRHSLENDIREIEDRLERI